MKIWKNALQFRTKAFVASWLVILSWKQKRKSLFQIVNRQHHDFLKNWNLVGPLLKLASRTSKDYYQSEQKAAGLGKKNKRVESEILAIFPLDVTKTSFTSNCDHSKNYSE